MFAGTSSGPGRVVVGMVTWKLRAAGCVLLAALAAQARPAAAATLVAVVPHSSAPSDLVQLFPRTLAPRAARPLKLAGYAGSRAVSPDASHAVLVVTAHRVTGLQDVDLRHWRLGWTLTIGRDALVQSVSWPAADRVLVVYERAGRPERFAVAVIDPLAGRTLARRALPAGMRPWQVEATPAGFALLLGPTAKIGPAQLGIVTADASLRLVALPGVRVGEQLIHVNGHALQTNVRLPGLAVDTAGAHAYVVPGGGSVVDVDLAAGVATVHALAGHVTATAAKGFAGPSRFAQWLDPGTIAVTGYDESAAPGGSVQIGLELIDISTWRSTEADPKASVMTVAAGLVLVSSDGPRLAAYGPDGRHWQRRFAGKYIGRVLAAGRYAYVSSYSPRHRTAVIDLASGRVVARLPTAQPPIPLAVIG
jgi:hypothetical protein